MLMILRTRLISSVWPPCALNTRQIVLSQILTDIGKLGKKKEHKEVAMSDVDRGVQSINGNKCLYRICKYSEKNDESIWYWRFYLLFDNETGKSCVLSSYDGGESTAYVYELLSSIQFK